MADFDMESRRVIEALRSGVPSRAVGKYFSESRPAIMHAVETGLDAVKANADGHSEGMVITGRYGEGKTHLLTTVFDMAAERNMVVSYVSIGRETPFDKLYLVYQKLISNTYLPGRDQPGFFHLLKDVTPNSSTAAALLQYITDKLQTDKLYYVLRAYLGTEDSDEKFLLQSDLEGDFISGAVLKKIYRRVFQSVAKFKVNFSKTKHIQDYFAFMSHLFRVLGYNGWVILVDEAELNGRLGKKGRLNAYRNMYHFLVPDKDPLTGKAWKDNPDGSSGLENTFSLFAFSSSYEEDVIDGKHDRENLEELFAEDPVSHDAVSTVIDMITEARQLQPLTHDEILQTVARMEEFHAKAYNWTPNVPADKLKDAIMGSGYLLRTRLRAAIEILDQLYQYGEAGDIRIDDLEKESYGEDASAAPLPESKN